MPRTTTATTIQHLPTEVLLQIFEHYLDNDNPHDWSKPTVRHSKETFASPLTLTHVCYAWRTISTKTPELWASIFILGPSSSMMPLIDLWLDRAEGCCLTIQFVERPFGKPDPEINELTKTLMDEYLWPWYDKWDEIDFDFARIAKDYEPPIVNIKQGESILHVRSARLRDRRCWNLDLTKDIWEGVIYSPALEVLEVDTLHIAPPHANLKELMVNFPMSLKTLALILEACPRLQKLGVEIWKPDEPANRLSNSLKIKHRRLRHLTISNEYDVDMTPLSILNALTLPNLEYLDIGTVFNGHGFLEAVFALLVRSGCSLRTLRGICIQLMPSDSFMTRFFSLPQLQGLTELRVLKASPAFHTLMTHAPSPSETGARSYGPPSILPHLKILELSDMCPCDWEFSDMVLSRFKSLKKIEVDGVMDPAKLSLSDMLWRHSDLTIEMLKPVDEGGRMDTWVDLIRTNPPCQDTADLQEQSFDAAFQFRADRTRPHRMHDPIFRGIKCPTGDHYYRAGAGNLADLDS
jgi:hypothetical protein